MPPAKGRRATQQGTYESVDASPAPAAPDAAARKQKKAKAVSVCLVGGKSLLRSAIWKLLDSDEIAIAGECGDEDAFAKAIASGGDGEFDLVLMILGSGSFSSYHRYTDIMSRRPSQPPVVVLSDDLSRGGVYTAIRMGAKAYVSLDSEPDELRRAILLAAEGKMHLSHDAAELMIADLTAGPRGQANQAGQAGAELSARETEIVQLLCEGLSSKQIATRLHVSPKTIENHRYNIYRKCQVDSIACLIRHAVQHGIVSL
jgi:DNA-binding NarL/FixJ family response regulator